MPIMQLTKGAYRWAGVTTTRHLEVSQDLPMRRFLNIDIVVRMDLRDWSEKPMNKLRTSLHFHQ